MMKLKFGKNINLRDLKFPPLDRVFLGSVILTALAGLVIVYEASVVYSSSAFGGKYHFVVLQAGWMAIGFSGAYILSRIDLQKLKALAPVIFLVSLLFLIIVLLPTPFSPEVYGAKRWIVLNPSFLPRIPFLGRLSFQPSEFAKLAGIIFFAAFLSSKKKEKKKESGLLKNFKNEIAVVAKFAIPVLLVAGLIMAEPDFTTSFVLVLILTTQLFFANFSIIYFLAGAPLMILVSGLYALSSEYRMERIKTLINPDSMEKTGAAYHINQVMIALGSGGLLGVGLGHSRQKYAYLPEVTADSIFAIVGEELGFIGAVLLVTLLVSLIFRGIAIAQNAQDRFAVLIVVGVISWFAIQTIINLAAMVRILPLTGMPLPLISYGGSSTIFILWGLGLVLNVSRKYDR